MEFPACLARYKECLDQAIALNAFDKAREYCVSKMQRQAPAKSEAAANEEAALTLAFRMKLETIMGSALQRGVSLQDAGFDLLMDVAVGVAEAGLLDPTAIFQLLSDAAEGQTVRHCEQVFRYLEERQASLTKELFVGKQAGRLQLLKLCNELLRRLSKAANTVLCGRILVLLAFAIPLTEKSGVNLAGRFNEGNVTVVEGGGEEGPIASDALAEIALAEELRQHSAEAAPIDYAFHRTFWSLQKYFANPALAVQAEGMARMLADLETVLACFDSHSLGDAEEGDEEKGEGYAVADNSSFVKFLTSSRLMSLQVNDPYFRRHVLLQFLVLFQYLRTGKKLEAQAPATPLGSTTFLRTKALEERVVGAEARIYGLLERTPPRGRQFRELVRQSLHRELNWVAWKNKSCFNFERGGAAPATPDGPSSAKKRKAAGSDGGAGRRAAGPAAGAVDIAKKLDASTNTAALTDAGRLPAVSLEKMLEPVREEADPQHAIEEEYKLKRNKKFVWRLLRVMKREDMNMVETLATKGDLDAVIRPAPRPLPPRPLPAPPPPPPHPPPPHPHPSLPMPQRRRTCPARDGDELEQAPAAEPVPEVPEGEGGEGAEGEGAEDGEAPSAMAEGGPAEGADAEGDAEGDGEGEGGRRAGAGVERRRRGRSPAHSEAGSRGEEGEVSVAVDIDDAGAASDTSAGPPGAGPDAKAEEGELAE
eukprot:tig00001229_g7837.t1